VCSSDLYRWLG
jgi:hypothetical protein